MRRSLFSLFLVALLFNVLLLSPVDAQERKATITGHATDVNHDPLVGAKVELQPLGQTAITDAQGGFKISDLAPGSYTVAISYVGFTSFSKQVTVAAGGTANVDAELQIETVSEQVIVRGERERGEIEALNREQTADNIVQVLPAEVITSLPNTNIADALGRLPSVSLERDEGEGKYVQIRGTEPRLSNVTLDGVHVPSPESVRNVKLDVIAADLIDSVEINKTLSPSQEGDAIGGSINLVTKRAGEQPFLSITGRGGYTPIGLGGFLDQFGATYGRRYGQEKRLGVLIGGSYDYNQRGTNDIEPSPGTNDFGTPGNPNIKPVFSSMDVREYTFYRHRFGFTSSADYKLGANSLLYLRGLFAQFEDNGENWNYTPSVGTFVTPNSTLGDGTMDYSHIVRRPAQRIFNVIAGANHSLGKTLVSYEVAFGQARQTGGFFSDHFSGPSNVQFAIDTSHPFTPKFNQVAGDNIFDPANYALGGPNFNFFRTLSMATQNHTFERDLTGSISLARQYTVGSHFGTFEVGAKVRDAHKSQNFHEPTFDTAVRNASLVGLSAVAGSARDSNYYFGNYKLLPLPNFDKVLSFFNANRGLFTEATDFEHQLADPNNYHTKERVVAGYVQNTITLGRFRVLGGLRIEGTQGSFIGTLALFNNRVFVSDTPVPGEQTYTNFLPSVQVQYNINSSTNIRAAYGRGIARPNFTDLPPFQLLDPSRRRLSIGNPALKPTHANDYDLLFEHYLKTVGLIEGGWFYKDLNNPIFQIQVTPAAGSFTGFQVRQQVNGPSAHIQGVELAWQQHLKFLPGLLNGMGVAANYSYTTSQASFPIDPNTGKPTRSDHPALLRQGPNNWNFDTTYDKGPISARMGLTHNDANIFFYFFSDGADGGIRGPNGDNYLYPHTQVDAQVSYRFPRARGVHVIVSMLNLTNEVFGFYQGSEQFPTQREYYSRTISVGFRWTPFSEAK
ncbi:MAG TPA: TonB-dependent receptor [Candidatus Acidoferrum sp.]|nr:TonB-dependent receptor [Candidatus Acidoferrum sp.]